MFNASNPDLAPFRPQSFEFSPLGISVQAVQVTQNNMGALSIVFSRPLEFDGSHGSYFSFVAEQEDYPAGVRLHVHISDWIIALRGELHVYNDRLMRCTFDGKFPEPSSSVGSINYNRQLLGLKPAPYAYGRFDEDHDQTGSYIQKATGQLDAIPPA